MNDIVVKKDKQPKKQKNLFPKGAKLKSNAKQKPSTCAPGWGEGKTQDMPAGVYVYVNGEWVEKKKAAYIGGAAVLDPDRYVAGVFDIGAGRVFNSNKERLDWMKKRGAECIG